MDGTGEWTVELSDGRRRARKGRRVIRRYHGETDAKTAVAAIYALSQHLAPLPTWDPQRREQPRWRVRTYEPV